MLNFSKTILNAKQANLLNRALSFSGASLQQNRVVAIRREDNSIWERRAPLAPKHVRKLTKGGIKILIQPSNRRAYRLQDYVRAGAEPTEDISAANVILGVKQVPVELLEPSKTYCFFSHTIKAQETNMPILDAVLDKNIRLIDYERLVDENDRRVVAFGKFAGVAGMINILHGLGLRLLALGHHTPFMHIGPAHNYRNTGTARQALRDTGYEIALGKIPSSIGPLTFVFTGSGNVSQGAQDIFNELPVEYVKPSELRDVALHGSTSKIYGSVVKRTDYLVRKSDKAPVDLDEYTADPTLYESNFSTNIAPYASVIINGVYWPPNAPRLLTTDDAKTLQQPQSINHSQPLQSIGSPSLPHRLIAICDISADPGGSIEFMQQCTTIDNPFILYDAETNKSAEQSFAGKGFLVCSIDNMPTQLPLESTDMFGQLLFPYIMDIIRSDATRPVEEEKFSNVVSSAIIASNSSLRPNFEYINDLRAKNAAASNSKANDGGNNKRRVLVLGAGHVSGPLIEYLCRDSSTYVTLVSQSDIELKYRLANKAHFQHDNISALKMDVLNEQDSLSKLIKNSQLVISLLPYSMHTYVGKLCIQNKVDMLTASYLNKEMQSQLGDASLAANVTILNEIGLDPGIDHLLAKQVIDDVKQRGGKVTSLLSFCCGLPTPESSNNPLGYKFGWNPTGAFNITMNPARWLSDGQICEAQAGELMNHARPVDHFFRGFSLEGFPNRDSVSYQSLYDLPDAQTLIRGTMRYKGFSQSFRALQALGFMDTTEKAFLTETKTQLTWKQLTSLVLFGKIQEIDLKEYALSKLNGCQKSYAAIEELGLLCDEPVEKCGSLLATTRNKLTKQYKFGTSDNDLVIMRLEFKVKWPNCDIEEKKALNMVIYGDTKPDDKSRCFSAMAKTVGYPAAIAAELMLNGKIKQKGTIVPLTSEIYTPILAKLRSEGIHAREDNN